MSNFKHKMPEKLAQKVLFDGGEGPKKWRKFGIPKGAIPDAYIEGCEAGAVNLNLLRIGSYPKCSDCGRAETCRNEAFVYREQAEI